jgi:cytochrome c-type biogenesis protein
VTDELVGPRPSGRPGRRAALAWALAAAAVAVAVLGVRAAGGGAVVGVDQVTARPAAALQDLAAVAPFGYAFGAGMLAAVNPCGFALLPAYLGLYLGSAEDASPPLRRLLRALRVAATLTAAFVLTFAVAGAAVAAVGASLGPALPVAGLLVGLGLAAAGAHVLSGGRLSAGLAERASDRLSRAAAAPGLRGYAAYGMAYAAASLGCALPIFLTVVGVASAAHDPARSAGQLLLYGLGMSVVITALTLATALARAVAWRRIRALGARLLGPATGVLLVATGAYVTAYWATLGFQ